MPLALLLVALLAGSAQAVEIHRCQDPSGRLVLTDRPCSALGARPAPRGAPPAVAGDAAEAALREPPPAGPPPRPEAADGCPGPTPEALGEALARAAARGDLNAIAGMFHWPAAGRGATARVFALAAELVRLAPLQWEVRAEREDDAWLWAGEPPPTEPRRLPPVLVLARPGADPWAEPVARFDLIPYAGCHWLPP
ncbi:MAG: hypothetical protein KatS3mg126_0168 [Lysobacteraceae bacterium]|nr:MAG: hypothetical protein KatS3mg126_0168 [Xanthomonadaceae bacterium]